jgi:hypothetical protein
VTRLAVQPDAKAAQEVPHRVSVQSTPVVGGLIPVQDLLHAAFQADEPFIAGFQRAGLHQHRPQVLERLAGRHRVQGLVGGRTHHSILAGSAPTMMALYLSSAGPGMHGRSDRSANALSGSADPDRQWLEHHLSRKFCQRFQG